MVRRRLVLAISLMLPAAAVVAVWTGSRQQQRAIAARVDLLTGRAAATSARTGLAALDEVPAPVARYLRWALPQPGAMRLVRMTQRGTLRTDPEGDRWMAFEAEHLAAPIAVGFLWNARVVVAPLLHVRVRDAFIDGEGSGQVSLLSAFPVSAAAGTPEMNAGALHRFLAEAVWYPAALLPGPKLQWSPIDDRRALATLTERGVTVSLEFRFAETGEVTGIYTPARWGTFAGGYEQRPWEGHFWNYALRDGVRVPGEADVGWYVGDEWRPVWKGTIVAYWIQ